jgi:PAS domain S-box-containing protein
MKIYQKLTFLMLFGILLPATIMTYINYSTTVEIITSIVKENLQSSVKQRINYVEHYSKHLLRSLKILSHKESLLDAYKRRDDSKMYAILYPHSKAHSFYDMFFISKNGSIDFTLQRESDLHENLYKKPLSQTKFALAFKELMKSKKATIANFSYYEPSHKYASFLLVPIFKNGEIMSVLAAQLDIDMFVQLSSDYSGLGKSGEIIFAEKIDNKAVFINKLRNDNEKIFKRSVKMGSKNAIPIQKALEGKFGSGIYDDYENVEVIASWGYIKSFDIGMVVKINTSEAYAKIEYLKNLVLLMGIIIFIVILYLIWHIKEMVKALDDKRTQYEYAINGTEDGLWDWNLMKNTIYFSPRLKSMLGYEDDELENSVGVWKQLIHPDDLERTLNFIAICHKDPFKEYNIEYRLRHKDNSWVWILDRGKTIFYKGKAVRMVGFHTNITPQKDLEEKLRHSQQEFEQFMEYIPAHIMILNDRRILYANSEAIKSFKPEVILGKTAQDLLPKDIADEITKFESKVLEEGTGETTIEIPHSDGTTTIFHNISFVIGDSANKKQGVISLDVTQRYRDQKALEEKEEIMIAQSRHAAMGEMISMIAHQWRQPISVIAMDANNVLVDIELDSLESKSLKSDIKDIIEQTQYLSKTIDDFRDFFKPSKIKDDVLVSSVFDESLAVILKSLENNNIEVINEFETQTFLTLFSRELLQVFINILKNAKEALVENKELGRKIINRVYEDEVSVIVSICDNAGGITDEVLEKIFEPYFTTKESKNGTGLGLYMSKTIIEKHLKGSIVAVKMIEGLCFEIRLPKIEISDK